MGLQVGQEGWDEGSLRNTTINSERQGNHHESNTSTYGGEQADAVQAYSVADQARLMIF